jgi:hypothetical protein
MENQTTTPNAEVESPEETNESQVEEPTPNQELVDSVISDFNSTEPDTLNDVNLLLDTEVRDMLSLLESNDSYAQWAGLYTLSNIAHKANETEKPILRKKMLEYADGNLSSFRFMAAVTLVTMGETEGIGTLISLLGENNEALLMSEPPVLICTYSNQMLVRYTEEDFGFSCSLSHLDEQAKQDWEVWWAENQDGLAWDNSSQKMVVS